METCVKTLLKGGQLVSGGQIQQADLLMDGGIIKAIDRNLPEEGCKVVDVRGCIVLPGAIDTHTHMDLPVSQTVTADDFESGTKAAIMGGTTSILDFATQDKGHTLLEAYEVWKGRMNGKASCDVGFHMAITDWSDHTCKEIGTMQDVGITSYKLYMAYPNLMVEDDEIYAALRRIREVGGIAGFHCENGRLVTSLVAEQRAKGNLKPFAHALSRPPAVEAEAIARLLRIAHLAQAPVNIVHLSSAEGLDAIRQCKKPGQAVYVETCPQYLLLDDRLLDREDGEKYICSPPLRKLSDQQALWKALANDEIDTIGTDHCSFRYADQKTVGKDDFYKVPNGLPGAEDRVSLLMTYGVAQGKLSLVKLVQKISENPAKMFGLYPRKGMLANGSDADVVIWDPAKPREIQAAAQTQRVDYNAYEGMHVCGSIRDVWLRGQHVVVDGILAKPNAGMYLYRNSPFSKKC